MGTKLLWTGLTLIVAVVPVAKAIGLSPDNQVIVVAGAILMVIGCVAHWLGK